MLHSSISHSLRKSDYLALGGSFYEESSSEVAAAVMSALGSSFYTQDFGGSLYDDFAVVDSFAKNSSGRDLLRLYGDQRWTNLDADDVVLGGTRGSWMFRDGVQRVVVLEVAEGGGGVVEVSASTPEPSLIFGFITLGGLMLGSKRKIKG